MFRQSVKMAWKSISSNKLRSLLTMLGIIIGVMSLVVLVSLVNGATSSVNDQISNIGTNLLSVRVSDDKGNPLSLTDISEIMDYEEIKGAAPVAQKSVTARSTYSEETSVIYGTTGAYVAVINAGLAVEVMGRMNVVGEQVTLNGVDYQIIGVLAAKSSDTSTLENYKAYIPYTSLIRLADDISLDVTSFVVSASSEETMDEAKETLTEIMMERFSRDEDAFTIINQSAVMEAMESVNNTLALLLGGIAGISLLVGGIGIMNIMLVSVTERTREIGIRKAIGAGKGTIMLQFLIEALMISLMGCALGVCFSWITLRVISVIGDGETVYTLSMGVVWLAAAFSMLVGVVFGIYPAKKAADKKPIEALRYTG